MFTNVARTEALTNIENFVTLDGEDNDMVRIDFEGINTVDLVNGEETYDAVT